MSDNPRTHADYIEVVKLQANLFRLTTHVHTWIASGVFALLVPVGALTTHVHTWIASAVLCVWDKICTWQPTYTRGLRRRHTEAWYIVAPDNPRTHVDCVSKTAQKQSIKLYKWGLWYFVPSPHRLKREAMWHWERFPRRLLLGSNQYEDRSLMK